MNRHRTEAEKLRESGFSYNMISEKLGIAKSTLSEWFKNKPFKPNKEVLERIQYGPMRSGELQHNRRVKETLELTKIGRAEVGALTKRDIHLLGIGLYIGEGSKAHEQVQFVNANPEVIKIMIRWFTECCNLTMENITISLHIYPDTNEQDAIKYWRDITKIPMENFRQTIVDRRKDKSQLKSNKLPYGTAQVRIKSNGDPEKGVRLHRKLQGWMEAVLS